MNNPKAHRRIVDTDTPGGQKYARELSEKNRAEAILRILSSDGFVLLTFSDSKDATICNLGMANVPKAVTMLRDALRSLVKSACESAEREAQGDN